MYTGLHLKCPLSLSDFNEPRIFSTDFGKTFEPKISRKCFQWVGGVTDGQADMTKLVFACRSFANAPKISAIYLLSVLMCSIRHAQYEVIVPPYNRLVPLIETVGVCCELRLNL
jgi:hypothetical protein